MAQEHVYFVNENDVRTGETSEKYAAHHANTKLHAAFSCYIFNNKGQILATKRADTKKVWPGVWTNSCCGHPFPDEEDGVKRRVLYELGLEISDLQKIIPTYMYKTPPYKGIIEHEFCPVFVAKSASSITLNPEEVSDYKWMDWNDYIEALKQDPDDYSAFATSLPDTITENMPKWSWWCKDQLRLLEGSKEFENYLQ